jgi:cytochrome c-type biogenesis protein CcmH/NrfG
VGGAVQAFQRAVEIQPRSLRNNYFLGVAHYHNSDFAAAARHFEFALSKAESLAPTEVDVADFFKRESRRALGVLQEKLGKSEL